jgi:hypothetical protein
MLENGALVPIDWNNAEIFDVGRARRVLRKQGARLVRNVFPTVNLRRAAQAEIREAWRCPCRASTASATPGWSLCRIEGDFRLDISFTRPRL